MSKEKDERLASGGIFRFMRTKDMSPRDIGRQNRKEMSELTNSRSSKLAHQSFIGSISRSQVSSSDSEISMSTSKSSASSTPHAPILERHPVYEVTYDMMLGIRTAVGVAYSEPIRKLKKSDFHQVAKWRFPAAGSKETPAHKARDFKFKDYHPQVFRHLRERWGIDPVEYMSTVTDNHYLEFISNSKSGQFFFFTHDKQFMIKTMSKEECKFLRQILRQYYSYVMNNKDSLLTRFFGIHRVKPHRGRKMRFLVMKSVFFTDMYIHESYDIKGSTHGRAATPQEKEQEVPILKDNDFVENNMKIRIQHPDAKRFLEQIRNDAEFLRSVDVMDYSLLIGIHYRDRSLEKAFGALDVDVGAESKVEESKNQKYRAPPLNRRQSHYGLKNTQDIIRSSDDLTKFEIPSFEDSKIVKVKQAFQKKEESSDESIKESAFCRDNGGISGWSEGSKDSDRVYFMGIIDILQTYNAKKRAEHILKGMKVDSKTISAVSPKFYADRFCEFLQAATEPVNVDQKMILTEPNSNIKRQ